MEKITMDEVQIKLEQIEASLQLTLEGMCGDFSRSQEQQRRK